MPLDILYEVFKNMHPLDLLQVSRTNKAFRGVLMSRSSAWIWKGSFAAAQDLLPPLHEDLTIPQFISLIFDRTCSVPELTYMLVSHYLISTRQFCCAPNVSNIMWAARARSCRKCVSNRCSITASDMMRTEFPREAFRLMLPIITHLPVVEYDRKTDGVFYPSRLVHQFREEYELEAKGQDHGTQQRWQKSKAQEFRVIAEHADACEKWYRARQSDREAELQGIRNRRKVEIIQRLTDLGWGEELGKLNLEKFGKLKFVHKSQLLSDRIWAQIKAPLLEYLEEAKAQRLAKEKSTALQVRYCLLIEAYKEFCSVKPIRSILPGVGNISTTPQVDSVIRNTPYNEELPKAAVCTALDDIPASYFEDWRKKCDSTLVELLNSTPRDEPATEVDLKLAATIFVVKGSWNVLPYPLVLVSSDVTRCNASVPLDDFRTIYGQQPWSTRRLEASSSQAAKQLVELAGLDPETATSADMDELDPWYLAQKTRPQSWDRPVAMTWRCARVQPHNLFRFELLGPEETAAMRKTLLRRVGFGEGDVECRHCDARFTHSTDLCLHHEETFDS
ncbi:hypothetical protein BD626DRAFT_104585 [Schizophyllum amplum]|uniref:F-box domain-containing protein n=1 Tax=Schizophyllum amplum TaxID=97359 RepID=A0A550CSB2_9AGAR|nr:hypothetical protein BD626DRAFT_104585 [Auriculariopsis ampla]